MDPNKDGDGTFAETFGNIKPLKSCLSIFIKGLQGNLENIEVPDGGGNGVKWLGKPLKNFMKKFIKIGQQDPCSMFCAPRPLIDFCWIQKQSYSPYNIHGERWCIQINPNLLAKEHFILS